MISQRARYAIRSLRNIAPRAAPVSAAVIAAEEQIPRKFLEAILAELKQAGLLVSLRGARGGYRLARPGETRTALLAVRDATAAILEARHFGDGDRADDPA